jgi:small subunit ribosomal protein S18
VIKPKREFKETKGGKSFGAAKGRRGLRKREKKDDIFSPRSRKKVCRLCEEKITDLDYKDVKRVERLVSERGKILSRRITGACAKHQRKIEEVVKIARFLALVPYVKK